MRSIWYRTGTGRRILICIVAALLVAGTTVTLLAWLGTDHGSPAFHGAMAWGRTLLQLAAGTGIVALLAITTRAKKRN